MMWRPIPGFSKYEVSDEGEVRSARSGRAMARFVDASGYYRLGLRDNAGARVNVRVHVLVMAAFIGPRPHGLVTRHIDGNHLNNTPTNLAYGTQSENVRDSIAHGTQRNSRKTHCIRGHAFTPANTRIEGTARKCRTCRADRERQRRAERKSAA